MATSQVPPLFKSVLSKPGEEAPLGGFSFQKVKRLEAGVDLVLESQRQYWWTTSCS